jgi:hypothetical protein
MRPDLVNVLGRLSTPSREEREGLLRERVDVVSDRAGIAWQSPLAQPAEPLSRFREGEGVGVWTPRKARRLQPLRSLPRNCRITPSRAHGSTSRSSGSTSKPTGEVALLVVSHRLRSNLSEVGEDLSGQEQPRQPGARMPINSTRREDVASFNHSSCRALRGYRWGGHDARRRRVRAR